MKNDWEKKEKTCSAYLSSKIFATSARIWMRNTSLSSVQLIPYIYPAFVPFGRYFSSIHLSLWIRHSPLSSTRWHSLLPKNHMLFTVSKQCACSRRVHIEGHMNRFEFLLSWTIIPITIVLGLFCQKNLIFCSITRC